MIRRQLPIGTRNLRRMRARNCYYVDKTHLIRHLIDDGDEYFLSRPRRFGKSLLINTLKELFEGNEPLFRDLAIHGDWDWSVRHPVIRLSFGGSYHEPDALHSHLTGQLEEIESDAGLDPIADCPGQVRLLKLIRRLHRATGQQVVVLVDEYDKPVLDVIDDPAKVRFNLEYLKGLYGVLKDSDEAVRFLFLAGVSMFSKASLFSGLNTLQDISLNPEYATICGYTDKDLDTVFAPEVEGLDRNEIRRWYNGYNWMGKEKVYNPHDILLLLQSRKFYPYWFESGHPGFLFKMMLERNMSSLDLEHISARIDTLKTFDIGKIPTEALLFQTGYLTLAEKQERPTDGTYCEGVREDTVNHTVLPDRYKLVYPNLEVKISLSLGLFDYLDRDIGELENQGFSFLRLLLANDFDGFAEQLRTFLAGIPYQWHSSNGPARYESWYAAMLFSCFRIIEADVRAEVSSERGRADMVLLHGGQVFIFELKMAAPGRGEETAAAAIAQIRDRGYVDMFRNRGEPMHLLGLAFSRSGGPDQTLTLRVLPA